MPHFFRDPEGKMKSVLELQNHPVVGTGTCVDLAKVYADGLGQRSTKTWLPSTRLVDVASIAPGTAIATFLNGKYPGQPGGNHFAFFIRASEVVNGKMTEAVIMDQFHMYNGQPRVRILTRMIRAQPKQKRLPNGDLDMSNDLNYFYVVE